VTKMSDVAKRAGVALSTVSYAINGTRPISEETRQKIFAAMEELGYKPHALARGLASRRSHIVALLFPAIHRGLGNTELEFVTNATEAARENGYNLVLWSSTMSTQQLRELIQQGLVDGVVAMEVSLHDQRVEMLHEMGIPFSLIGRCEDTEGIDFADIDFDQTVREVIDYLSGLGHRHIGFLNQSRQAYDEGYGPVLRTQNSFEAVMQARGLYGPTQFCRTSPLAGYEATLDLLKRHPELTALVAMNERAVPGILRAVADRGWRIPEDFSLVVIVSSERVADMYIPHLTTSDSPSAELGRMGVELLIQKLEYQDREVQQILVPCRLAPRGSTGPCRPRNLN
jgi:DNA-binding LacI/PurR family transcriptional regulator